MLSDDTTSDAHVTAAWIPTTQQWAQVVEALAVADGRVGIAFVQCLFRIGYKKASSFVDVLHRAGLMSDVESDGFRSSLVRRSPSGDLIVAKTDPQAFMAALADFNENPNLNDEELHNYRWSKRKEFGVGLEREPASFASALHGHRYLIAKTYEEGLLTSFFVLFPYKDDERDYTAEQYVVTVLRPDAMLEDPYIIAGNRIWERPVVRHIGSNEPAEYCGVQEGQIALPIWPSMTVADARQIIEFVRAALFKCSRDSDDRGYNT